MKLSLTSEGHNPCHVLAAGKLQCGRQQVTDPLRALVGYFAARRVVLSLRGITSFDTSGLAWLVASHHALAQARGELVLLYVPASVRRALALLGLQEVFCPADSAGRPAPLPNGETTR